MVLLVSDVIGVQQYGDYVETQVFTVYGEKTVRNAQVLSPNIFSNIKF